MKLHGEILRVWHSDEIQGEKQKSREIHIPIINKHCHILKQNFSTFSITLHQTRSLIESAHDLCVFSKNE